MCAVGGRGGRLPWTAIATCAAIAVTSSVGSGCAHRAPRFEPAVRRTCLVLSVGGTRGVAELGAIAAVQKVGLHISCVVGTSVGALVGGLFASAPEQDTTARFRRLAARYLQETDNESHARGIKAGVALAALAAGVSGGILVPTTAALGGYLIGSATTTRADRSRLERVLRTELGASRIETLPLPFATMHHERVGDGVALIVDRSGDLARAVGSSIANPFVFDDVDVTSARGIDPGTDRVAATPVQDACRLFPDANLLVVNVSGSPAFYDATMLCPLRETMIDVEELPAEAFFQGGEAFDRSWKAGYDAVAAALGSRSRS